MRTRGIKSFLIWVGIYYVKYVPVQEIHNFLAKLHPVKIDRQLVRIGSHNDGGYLIPDDFDGVEACFSPGVGFSTNFEEDLAQIGIYSFLADGSLEKLQSENKMLHFINKYLGDQNTNTKIRLEDWITTSLNEVNGDLILQMDIEGGEYLVINDTPAEIFKQFRIIVIEFHQLEILFSKEGFKKISSVFEKILSNFKVVHIHPNNCKKPFTYKDVKIPPVMEFTFLRNDRIKKLNQENGELSNKLSFPHTLDEPNVPNRVDYALPKCWYSI